MLKIRAQDKSSKFSGIAQYEVHMRYYSAFCRMKFSSHQYTASLIFEGFIQPIHTSCSILLVQSLHENGTGGGHKTRMEFIIT